jgi:hypothetical protein
MKRLLLERHQALGEPKDEELELVSTQMLKTILSSRNRDEARAVKTAARTASEGVLVRHRDGHFEIIDDEEFDEMIAGHDDFPRLERPSDVTLRPLRDYAESGRFSLVSSRALRRALDEEDDALSAIQD